MIGWRITNDAAKSMNVSRSYVFSLLYIQSLHRIQIINQTTDKSKKRERSKDKIHKTTQKTLIKKTSTYNIKETHKTPQIRSRQEITQMK